MLGVTRLQALPEELAGCTSWNCCAIAATDLAELRMLFKLPRLSWLAYAGNPYCKPAEKVRLR